MDLSNYSLLVPEIYQMDEQLVEEAGVCHIEPLGGVEGREPPEELSRAALYYNTVDSSHL
jgi:hypothetical protein